MSEERRSFVMPEEPLSFVMSEERRLFAMPKERLSFVILRSGSDEESQAQKRDPSLRSG